MAEAGNVLNTDSDIGLDKYWPLTSRDDVFLAIALGAVSPNAIEKLTPPVITNTREWLLYMYGNGGFDGNVGLVDDPSGKPLAG